MSLKGFIPTALRSDKPKPPMTFDDKQKAHHKLLDSASKEARGKHGAAAESYIEIVQRDHVQLGKLKTVLRNGLEILPPDTLHFDISSTLESSPEKALAHLIGVYQQTTNTVAQLRSELERCRRDIEGQKRTLADTHDRHNHELKAMKQKHRSDANNQEEKYQDLQRRFLETGPVCVPLADEHFKEGLMGMRSRISGFASQRVPGNWRDLGSAFKQTQFVSVVQFEKEARLVLEREMWQILVKNLFAHPFRCFGNAGDEFFATWCNMFPERDLRKGQNPKWPKPSERAERWRYTTIEALSQEATSEGNAVQKSRDENYATTLDSLQTVLSKAYSKISPDQHRGLQELVDMATTLAFEMGKDFSRIWLLEIGVDLRSDEMDESLVYNRNFALGPSNFNGKLLLSISPSMQRRGDARGGSLDTAHMYICPGEVFLGRI